MLIVTATCKSESLQKKRDGLTVATVNNFIYEKHALFK